MKNLHGGDIWSYKNFSEEKIIDFSTNINPLGFPKELKEKIFEEFDGVKIYPDVEYRNLKKNIAKYLKTDSRYIAVGNGSVDIIDQVIRNFKRVLLVEPCFSEYELRANVNGVEVLKINADENLKVPIHALEENILEGDLLILGNPNNPTGISLKEFEILAIYKKVLEKNAYLLLDEAFFEFCDQEYDSVEIFKKFSYSNVGIIRAATKFFALPGIRLGYGVFEKDLLERMEYFSLPWRINSCAEIAAEVIFEDENYIKNSVEYIKTEREFLVSNLKKIKGVFVYPSTADFILLKIENMREDELFYSLLKCGIMVRRCSNFENLSGTHIRIAVKNRESNEKLILNLKKILEV